MFTYREERAQAGERFQLQPRAGAAVGLSGPRGGGRKGYGTDAELNPGRMEGEVAREAGPRGKDGPGTDTALEPAGCCWRLHRSKHAHCCCPLNGLAGARGWVPRVKNFPVCFLFLAVLISHGGE